MPVPIPEFDVEYGNAIERAGSPGSSIKRYVAKAAQTALLTTPINVDGTSTFPTGYTSLGGIGTVGIACALRTTGTSVADSDFTGATPAIPAPPIGTLVYNNSDHKLRVRDAAASWLTLSIAFS